jgi:hypothetical protein
MYLTGLFLFFSIETKAQEAGTHSAIPSKNTVKGRRELRKDKRIKRHEEQAEKSNQEKFEVKSDKPFYKKEHKTASQDKRKEEEIIHK